MVVPRITTLLMENHTLRWLGSCCPLVTAGCNGSKEPGQMIRPETGIESSSSNVPLVSSTDQVNTLLSDQKKKKKKKFIGFKFFITEGWI